MMKKEKNKPEEGDCQGEMTPPGQPCGEYHYPAPPRRDTPPPPGRTRQRDETFDTYEWARRDD